MEEVIDQIEEIRAKNNKAWMGLLRLALETAPARATALLAEINANDRKIGELLGSIVLNGGDNEG